MPPLTGKTFVLELGRDVRFKAKQELVNYLREQNANISYILTASTDYVLVSNDVDSYKTRRARQLGIPLLNVNYIHECRTAPAAKELLDIKRFIVTSAEEKENFSKTGTIPVAGSSTGGSKPPKFDPSRIKIWNADDAELPPFDETGLTEIGKWAIFKETNDHSEVYFALELQIIPSEHYNPTIGDYRFRFRYEKQTVIGGKRPASVVQYAYSHDVAELQQLFAWYYHRTATMPRITRLRDLLPDKLGSKLLLRSLFLHRIDTQTLDDNVCQLIESLWVESIGDLHAMLTVSPESIALKTIIEAEAALLEIKSDSKSASEAETRFYSLIPHEPSFVVDLIKNRRALIDKIDLCQMLRDMLTINELTGWNVKASIEAKYRALKCYMKSVDADSQEHSTISQIIKSSTNADEEVVVHQIYNVAKQTDALNFRSALSNQRLLFHGSKYNNFLGILTRGLMMPKLVVDDLGVSRTDFGCLGYGIYFSDSASTSLKYTTASNTRPGRRLLCISQVALGNSAKYYSYAPGLTQSPESFQSTHGVKRDGDNHSKFIDDEFVVYSPDQQRLLYVVEVSWKPHDAVGEAPTPLPIVRDLSSKSSFSARNEADVPTSMEDEVIQVAEQDYGLICPSSGQLVPLKAFHIRAQLVDVTAEVVLYQVYHNTSSVPIEAKYVFPLDENCSVCGFEAHINNKVIKGVVKEKEQAKREYREAIEKGHGAYLMHQEQPEVFSVSVGNLPANCEVIIKITYVAELPIENNDIIFRLPAKVASWQSKQALEAKDQAILPSVNLGEDSSAMKAVEFSLRTSIRMPYEISKVFSPTHRLRRKVTDCLAMIELVDNVLLEKDFILSITLKSINLPRMLNESYALLDEEENNNTSATDELSQACMLTFYPKFDMAGAGHECAEVVFIIDVSNSMDGNHVQQAKQLAHLFLTSLKSDDGSVYFNIVTFGSDNDECFPISSPNTKDNIEKAKHFILHSLDHRGNTDLFSVLRQYSLLPSPSKLGRQFILLSDGHINDLPSVLTLLENQPTMARDRFFTCSIGDTSNKHQLKQLANGAHGGGLTTVFDSNYRSRWKSKVQLLLEHIRQPCVTNISIDWHGNADDQQVKFTSQAPKMIRSLFNGMRLTVYRFIRNCHKATLTAMISDQEFSTTVFSNKITETRGRILHCLTARAIIHDYENGLLHVDESENELMKKQYKQDLIDLSVKYSVVSSFTSFVAIEERDGEPLEPGVRLLDVMLEHDIDLLPYIGWDGDRSQAELIKEKLLNGKRMFDSASIASKAQLTMEYEDLCQKVSYRAGGDAKYDLMLTIVETYRGVLNDSDKARELERKMHADLRNEMANATAAERSVLEQRLEDVNRRLPTPFVFCSNEDDEWNDSSDSNKSPGSVCSDGILPLLSEITCFTRSSRHAEGDGIIDSIGLNAACSEDLANSSESFDYDKEEEDDMGFCVPEFDKRTAAARGPRIEQVTDSEDDDMGWGLFDDDAPTAASVTTSTKAKRAPAAAAAPQPRMETSRTHEEEEEGGEDEVGFGLFDLDTPAAASVIPCTKAKPTAVVDSARLKENDEDGDMDMGFTGGDAAGLPLFLGMLKKKKAKAVEQDEKSAPSMTGKKQKEKKLDLVKEQAVKADLLNDLRSRISLRRSLTSHASVPEPEAPVPERKAVARPQDSSESTIRVQEETEWEQKVERAEQEVLKDEIASPRQRRSKKMVSPSSLQMRQQQQQQQQQQPMYPGTSSQMKANESIAASYDEYMPVNVSADDLFGGFSGAAAASTWSPLNVQNNNNAHTQPLPTSSHVAFAPTLAHFAQPPPPPPPLPAFMAPINQSLFGSGQPAFSLFNQPISTTTTSAASYGPFSFPPLPPSSPPYQAPPLNPTVPSYSPTSPAYAPAGFSVPQAQQAMISDLFGGAPVNCPSFVFGAPPPPPPPPPLVLFGSSPNTGLLESSRTGGGSVFSATSSSSSSFSFGAGPPPPPPPPVASMKTTSAAGENSSFKYAFTMSAAPQSEVIAPIHDEVQCAAAAAVSTRGRRGGKHHGSLSFSDKPKAPAANTGFLTSAPRDRAKAARAARYTDTRVDEDITPRLVCTSPEASSNFIDLNLVDRDCERAMPRGECIRDLLLLDVIPLGVGIEDANGHMCTIIPRNCTIPARRTSNFTNAYAYQTNATIRVFEGEHKLTTYNNLLGEFVLNGLTVNYASQTLEVSVEATIDANGVLHVCAEEPRSGAKASMHIGSDKHRLSSAEIERHVDYVRNNPDCAAFDLVDERSRTAPCTLKGDTENATVSFTGSTESNADRLNVARPGKISLTSTVMNALKTMQQADGSFDFNETFASTLAISSTMFDTLKRYLIERGFNSFALNVQEDILRLIATGIVLVQLLLQVPASDRKDGLMPFDNEAIKEIFRRHLPKGAIESGVKAVDAYAQKRLRCGIYCDQLELKHSSWEKFIQYGIFQLDN